MAALNEEATIHDYHVPVRSYGIPGHSSVRLDVSARAVEYAPSHTRFTVEWWGGDFPIETRLIGEFNVYNILCAVTAALAAGIPVAAIQAGVAALGRCAGTHAAHGRRAAVSRHRRLRPYPDQPRKRTAHPAPPGGPGQRERTGAAYRRLWLGGAARPREALPDGARCGELADYTVITAEDPRTEDLADICRSIERGVREFADSSRYAIVPDRTEAIQYAVDMARPGDVVAAFGKGHERSMCFGETEYPWSDQDTMLAALQRRPQ